MRALVVDDSSTMRKILKSILAGAGFEVAEAKGGPEALDSLRQNRADLALFDWNMPEMTGIELLAKVRSDHSYDAMRIMMVTTESEQQEIVRAMQQGANEYVDKLQIIGRPMKYRVLVVDDSVVMRRIVRQSLESDPDIRSCENRLLQTTNVRSLAGD